MRAHYLQHVLFEGLGNIEDWLNRAGYTITCSRLYDSPELPDVDELDFLIVMGGPMSVNDVSDYPWLVEEKAFIRDFIDTGKPVLGICLGAQLIASAMGARVYPNPEKGIGWFPVQAAVSSNQAAFPFPQEITAFHWHGETFDLPPEAIHLATSEGCKNQAFQLGTSVIGLQFHLETTPDSAHQIVSNCRDELVPGRYIQSEQAILSASEAQYHTIHNLMSDILEFLHHPA